MKRNQIKTLVMAAVCIALGILLPQVFMRNQQLGTIFLPMHLPVLLCGILCGWHYGGFCGIIVPLICTFLFGRPPIFPTAVAMCLELGAYGVVSGLCVKKWNLPLSLFLAMVSGRLVNGIANAVLLGFSGGTHTIQIFFMSSVVYGLPGVASQFILIPLVVVGLKKAGIFSERCEIVG